MRVLVCGGRDFHDRDFVYSTLDAMAKRWPPDVVIIEGDARGVDRMAGYWARKRGLTNLKFPADWASFGRAAGALRNQRMLIEGKPDLVIAFPGGHGTADMVRRARSAELPIAIVEYIDAPDRAQARRDPRHHR